MSGTIGPNRRGHNASRKGISNNILAMVTLMMMALSISCSILVYMATEPGNHLIGFSTSQDQAIIQVKVTLLPEITFFSPERCEVISGTDTITANASSIIGPDGIAEVRFYYRDGLSSEFGWTYMGNDYYDGDEFYDISWDTMLVDDGLYRLGAIAIDTYNLSSIMETRLVSVNNFDTEPDWEEFKNNISTNLSLLSEWHNVSGMIIGNSWGFLNFSSRDINVDGANLSRSFNISKNKFLLDSSEIPCINGQVYLHFTNVTMVAPNVYRNGVPCSSVVCNFISHSNKVVVVDVSDFATYQLVNNANYDIWDITDSNRTPGNQTKYKNQQVEFFLNLSANNIPLNSSDISCLIRFNITNNFTVYSQMVFGNRSLYEYNRSFSAPGVYRWEVICNSTEDEYFSIFDFDNITISNRAPRLIKNLPNITMEEDTVALYVNDLNDYFVDPEGDRITFSVSYMPNVMTEIIGQRSILIRPARDWNGNRTFVVYATDEFGLQNISNWIYLKVIDMPEPPQPPRPYDGGGGGSSGTSYYEIEKENPECNDEWVCSDWGECMFRWTWNATGLETNLDEMVLLNENDGIRSRSCYDQNNCDYYWKKPNETEPCFYVPTCRDSIRNQNETGVDCGGPCPTCFTCADGIQNQGEEDIDCGGPCPACPSCFDGIMNCHDGHCEKGIDCGGPCSNVCPEEESPAPRLDLFTTIMIGLLMLALFFTFYLFIRPYLVRIYIGLMTLKKRKEVAPEATLLEIETHYLAMLEELRKRAARANPAKVSGELNSLFRKFLMIAFKVKEESTLEELSVIVRKTKLPAILRMALVTYIGEIAKMGYSKALIERKEIISHIDRAKELLDLIVRNIPKEEPIDGDKGKSKDKDKNKGKGRHDKKSGKPALRRNALGELYRLGVSAKRELIKGDIDAALLTRKDMGKIYKKLKKHEREHYRRALKRLDEDISVAKKGDRN